MVKEIEFGAGCHIDEAAKMLVAAAIQHGGASGKFNEIKLTAGPETMPHEVTEYFTKELAASSERYWASPEGKRSAKESADRKAAMQETADRVVSGMSSLDWSKDIDVLKFACDLQEPSDFIGVVMPKEEIVAAFERHGYAANANTGKDYNEGNRDNEFRYLIGQAVSGLKDGPAIHSIIHKFAGEWRKRYEV